PTLLLADEPTGNLDSATGKQIIDLLVALNRNLGSTLVLVTHDPALAALADRVITLRDGRVAADELNNGRVARASPARSGGRGRGAGRHFAELGAGIAGEGGRRVGGGSSAPGVKRTVGRAARALMGGDVEMRSAQPLSAEGDHIVAILSRPDTERVPISEL